MRKAILAIAVSWTNTMCLAAAQRASSGAVEKQESSFVCPFHEAHAAKNDRAKTWMGFSQTATSHHFLMKADGGVVQVEAHRSNDVENRGAIRMHLLHITQAFSNGDFDIPMLVHDVLPPGVPEMRRLRDKIQYSFEETAWGGRVSISTADKGALAAIHKFLRFQIEEHKTGDPTPAR
jgi:hypothetical protein